MNELLKTQTKKDYLRHRIHQWSVTRLVETLNNKPIHVVEISEAYSSSVDPFTKKLIKRFTPSVIRYAVRGVKKVRIVKIVLRVTKNGLDRDVIGAINIGLRYLNSDGRCMAFTSTEPHEVWLRLVIPHRGLTQTTEYHGLGNAYEVAQRNGVEIYSYLEESR